MTWRRIVLRRLAWILLITVTAVLDAVLGVVAIGQVWAVDNNRNQVAGFSVGGVSCVWSNSRNAAIVQLSVTPTVSGFDPAIISARVPKASDAEVVGTLALPTGIGWRADQIAPTRADIDALLDSGSGLREVTQPLDIAVLVGSDSDSFNLSEMRLYWGGGEPICWQTVPLDVSVHDGVCAA